MKVLLVLAVVVVPALSGRLPYIVGGQNIPYEARWPWMASMQGPGGGHGCGASLISSRWLVTAAHCVVHPTYTVVLGMHDVHMREGQPKRYKVARIIKHPQYGPGISGTPYDIALMYLDQDVDLTTKYVQPVGLPDKDEKFVGVSNCWITGWGAIRPNVGTTYLQEAHVDVISNADCNRIFGSIRDWHVCAGKKGQSTTCFGDSGGPLVCPINWNWKLVGAASWTSGGCNPSNPGAFANVAFVRDWIRQETGL